MKTIRSCKVLTLVSLATVLGALAAFAAEEVREEFHQTYPLNKQGRVHLENVNGNVHIVTWDREEIKVDAVKHAKKQERLDEVIIDVAAKADRIRIKTKYPEAKMRRSRNNSTSVDYTLTVPKQSRLDQISTVNGGVEIENVSGDVEASSVNGNLTASRLGGDVALSTVNGSVKANFTEVKKAVSLTSVAKTCTGIPSLCSARNSATTIAIEYASSPVEQPGTQMRIVSSCARPATILGRIAPVIAAKDSGSRKNRVTWIRMSW